MAIDLICLDADDTLWHNETFFRLTYQRFAALLAAFYGRTGCPLLVNTSFNVRGEPIVASPVDALSCMGVAGFDSLVLEDFLIDRAMLPASWADLLPAWRERARSGFAQGTDAISADLYTFV